MHQVFVFGTLQQGHRILVRKQRGPGGATPTEAWVCFGSEAGFAGAQVHAGPLAAYTLGVAAAHPHPSPG